MSQNFALFLIRGNVCRKGLIVYSCVSLRVKDLVERKNSQSEREERSRARVSLIRMIHESAETDGGRE